MANFKDQHPQNAPGPVFTDLSCIDCGTCFHLGAEIFEEGPDEKSVVIKQPGNEAEWKQAKRAILSCPTNSIGVRDAPAMFKDLDPELPLKIAENVSYLGFTARSSFGATTYLIERPEGNVLIDSPRFHPWPIKELEKRGGVRWMILSHQDDVADHQKFHDHFGCERFIHADDVTRDTESVEHVLDGEGPFQIAPDLRIITTPGHSKGHVCINYQEKFLFTGDHIFVDEKKRLLTASRGVCWYSWEEQIRSTEKLLAEKFQWVLPGHGGWLKTGEKSQEFMRALIEKMKN